MERVWVSMVMGALNRSAGLVADSYELMLGGAPSLGRPAVFNQALTLSDHLGVIRGSPHDPLFLAVARVSPCRAGGGEGTRGGDFTSPRFRDVEQLASLASRCPCCQSTGPDDGGASPVSPSNRRGGYARRSVPPPIVLLSTASRCSLPRMANASRRLPDSRVVTRTLGVATPSSLLSQGSPPAEQGEGSFALPRKNTPETLSQGSPAA